MNRQYGQLVKAHQAEVYHYLRFLGAEPGSARSLAVRTFVRASRGRRAPDSENPRDWAAWFRSIALDEYVRSSGKQPEQLLSAERFWKTEFGMSVSFSLYMETLEACLSGLGTGDRELLMLHYRDGLGADEIARRTGCTADEASSGLHRLRVALRADIRRRFSAEETLA
jgi:RNA polymerase sigma factor (sigma-70 family)